MAAEVPIKVLARAKYDPKTYNTQSAKIAASVRGRFSRGSTGAQNGYLLKTDDLEQKRQARKKSKTVA